VPYPSGADTLVPDLHEGHLHLSTFLELTSDVCGVTGQSALNRISVT
jgi:hypothetical protein